MEIVVESAPLLSVPTEAIIEEGDRRIVYVQTSSGAYRPREVKTGLRGELYTEIVAGVQVGDEVVTFGSFSIDAEQKLNATEQSQ
jgi:Cu(I)/Ag(I) efflux system membrane fusion protein